jgi:hypothetical protein
VLSPAADTVLASLRDAMLQRWDRFSTRGSDMNPRPGATAHRRNRGCSSAGDLRLETAQAKHKPLHVAEGSCRHDTGCRPQEHRPRWPPAPHRRSAADRLRHPKTLPSLNRGAVLASGVAGCPNAVQPELSIVSRLLIGPVGGNGKGRSGRPGLLCGGDCRRQGPQTPERFLPRRARTPRFHRSRRSGRGRAATP